MNFSPVFVLGMPRCRTAWLSMCASALGVDTSHEGLRDFGGDFAAYADELDARLAIAPAGDADPGLAYWLPEILARWPDARFAVVAREDGEALEALLKAAPEKHEAIRAGWSAFLSIFKGACDTLRARGEGVRFWMAHRLSDAETACDALEWITGRRPLALWVQRRLRLRVTASIDSTTPPPRAPGLTLPPLAVIDTAGLTVDLYRHEDFETVAAWWTAHGQGILPQAALPPAGVVVSHDGEPRAAVWAYECYGVPVAELTFPVTRPGLSIGEASRALLFAVFACLQIAGKAHIPQADFRFFKAVVPRPMARFLKPLGFREYLTERVPMLLAS